MERKRRERSDKKRSVNPYLPKTTKEKLYRLTHEFNKSFFETYKSSGAIGSELMEYLLYDKMFISKLSPHFKRGFVHSEYLYFPGQQNAEALPKKQEEESFRQQFRLKKESFTRLQDLAFSLELTWGSTAALLIVEAFEDELLIRRYDPLYKIGKEVPQYIYQWGVDDDGE